MIRPRLYDADRRDREVALEPGVAERIEDRQILWVDLVGRDRDELGTVAAAMGLGDRLVDRLGAETGRAALTQYPDHIHLVLMAMEVDGDASTHHTAILKPIELDLVAGRNWVVTVHEGPLGTLERFEEAALSDTQFGALDAAGFLAGIVDEVLTGYLELAEAIEREIDRLDERALRTSPQEDILGEIVALRRRIGTIRRTLSPHRLAFAALARPEMELHDELGRPWPALNDRLDRTIDTIENLRDLLLGSYDIHMGRAAQHANEIMKRLTLLSAVLLPAVVLAGVMGMNFKVEFFDNPSVFWGVVGAMLVFGLSMLAWARWRRWL